MSNDTITELLSKIKTYPDKEAVRVLTKAIEKGSEKIEEWTNLLYEDSEEDCEYTPMDALNVVRFIEKAIKEGLEDLNKDR